MSKNFNIKDEFEFMHKNHT